MESRRGWIVLALVCGLAYAAIGIGFARPTTHVQAWRFAAWIASGLVYAAHILYEHFQCRRPSGSAALHVASGVALGGFGLAVGANIHSLGLASSSQHRQLLQFALLLWPIVTALPAFVVALVISVVLAKLAGGRGGHTAIQR